MFDGDGSASSSDRLVSSSQPLSHLNSTIDFHTLRRLFLFTYAVHKQAAFCITARHQLLASSASAQYSALLHADRITSATSGLEALHQDLKSK